MHFTKLLLAAAGCAVASAKVALTNSDFSGITAGVPFKITWSGQTGMVSLLLKKGPGENQLLVDSLADGLSGTSWEWTPSKNLPEGTYNLEIDDTNGDINYSPQFKITGGVDLPITSGATATKSVPTNTAAPNATTITMSLSTGGPNTMTVSSSAGFQNSTIATGVLPSKTGVAPPGSTLPTSKAAHYASPFALAFMGLVALAFIN